MLKALNLELSGVTHQQRLIRRQSASLVLQPRDIDILCLAFRQQVVTREAIMRLGLFGSVPRAVSRLRQLFDAKLLDRHAAMWVAAPLVYTLGKPAVQVVADHLGLDYAVVGKTVQSGLSHLMLQHSLMQLATRVAFYEAAKCHGVTLAWRAESQCLHAYQIRRPETTTGELHVMRPDGYVRVSFGDRCLHAFVECDRGSEASRILCGKAEEYVTYRNATFERIYNGSDFSVLCITTSDRRSHNLRSAIGERPVPWLFTTLDRLIADAFGEIWLPIRGDQRVSLLADGGTK
jgi:hypothetical protein